MSQHVTRCPYCDTSFRVTAAQLQVAKGAVRCGNCQAVFNAGEYLLDRQQANQQALESAQMSAANDSRRKKTIAEATASKFAGRKLKATNASQKKQTEADSQPEINYSQLSLSNSAEVIQPSEAIANGKTSLAKFDKHLTKISAAQQNEVLTNPLALKEALRKSGALEPRVSSKTSEANVIKAKAIKTKETASHSTERPKTTKQPNTTNRQQASASSETAALEKSNMPRQTTRHLRYRRASERSPALPPRWPWLAGSLLALLVLLTQIHLLYFDQMVRLSQWRPYYNNLCQLIGCQLPSTQDVSLIKSQHLIVRPHPDFAQALTIDALLVNQASWPQPFPNILFEFRNNEGKTVAARSFSPVEYLASELRHNLVTDLSVEDIQADKSFDGSAFGGNSKHLMPSAIPVHITLEIVSPGETATAYELIPVSSSK